MMTCVQMRDFQVELGSRIRYVRERMEMKQHEFAQTIDHDQAQVSIWETGKQTPNLPLFVRLCEILDVCPNWLTSNESLDNTNAPLFIPRLWKHTTPLYKSTRSALSQTKSMQVVRQHFSNCLNYWINDYNAKHQNEPEFKSAYDQIVEYFNMRQTTMYKWLHAGVFPKLINCVMIARLLRLGVDKFLFFGEYLDNV